MSNARAAELIYSAEFLSLMTAAVGRLSWLEERAAQYPSEDNYWQIRVAETKAGIAAGWELRGLVIRGQV